MPVYMLTKGNNSGNNRQNGRVIWGAIYLFLLSIWFTRSYAPEFDNCKSLLIGLYFTSAVNRKGGPTRLIACLLTKGARRQVQGGALAPPGFCFSVSCRALFMHSV